MSRILALSTLIMAGASACGDGSSVGSDLGGTDASEVDVPGEIDVGPELPPPPQGRIVINEVACRADPEEWVELANVGDAPVDLRGYRVADAAGHHGVAVPAIVLEPGAKVVVSGDVGLSCDEDETFVIGDGRVIDKAPVRRGDPEVSAWGRVPDGDGEFVETAPTPQKANVALADERASLFQTDGPMPVIDLYVDGAAEDLLSSQQKVYAPALFTWTDQRGTSAPQRIDVRIKGSITLRPWSGKPSLKLHFARHEEAGPRAFRGAKKLALHNLAYDPSAIREWLAYEVMRAAGQPAPRVGWVDLRVNGVSKGLYGLIESYDEVFLRDWFPSTEALYEGDGDLTPGLGGFSVDEGEDVAPLEAIAERVAQLMQTGSRNATTALPEIDWKQLAGMFGLEDVLQHTDGMKAACHNYFMHLDAEGRWSFLPWSVDLTLLPQFGAGALSSCSQLAQLCDRDEQCVAWFQRARDQAAQQVLRTDLMTPAVALATRAQTFASPKDEPWSGSDGFWPDVAFDLAGYAREAVELLNHRAQGVRCATAVAQGQPAPEDDPSCFGFNGPGPGGGPK